MTFLGFADKDAKFFRALAKNQKKEWFQAHKDDFESGYHGPMKALLGDVSAAIDGSYPHVDLDEPRVFRIYRDVRFSKDKAPYKTHVAGVIPVKRTAKMTEVPIALYFHVGQPQSFGAAGHYMMDTHALEKFREAIADDKRGKELERLLGSLRKKGFTVDSHDTYKRVPKGYDPDHPRAEHLKRKGLTVGFPCYRRVSWHRRSSCRGLLLNRKLPHRSYEWLVFATL